MTDQAHPPGALRAVALAAAATLITVVEFSLTAPVIVVELAGRGHTGLEIGAYATAPFLMLLLVSPFAPDIRARLGDALTLRIGLALATLSAGLTPLVDGLWAWAALDIAGGLAAALLWGIAERAVARHAPAGKVGQATGLYQTALAAAFMIGPLLALAAPLEFRGLLWLGAAIALAAWAPIVWPGALAGLGKTDEHSDIAAAWKTVLAAAPALLVAALLGGVYETGVGPIATAFAARHLGELAVALPAVLAAGSLLAQWPIGLLADKVGVGRMLVATILSLAGAGALFAFADAAPWLIWPLAAIWGAIGGGLYTLVMIQVGVTLRAAAATATAAVVTTYTLGGAIGPPATGAANDLAGTVGVGVVLAALSLGALVGWRLLSKQPAASLQTP
ncbi:MAG: MFS transporter [Caulobacterales bacterium]